jgi:predicted ATPase
MAATPVVKRLILKRFRSFPSEQVEFDNPTILVGRNGAGKSNFADVFAFLAESMASPLQAVFDRRGGIDNVRNHTSDRTTRPNLGMAVEFGPINDTVMSGRYAFEVKSLPNYGFQVVREQCRVTLKDGRRHWFNRTTDFKMSAPALSPSIEPSALGLPVIGGDERFAPILRALSAMRKYYIEPSKIREMQDPDSGLSLRTDGSNTASVLQELSRNSPEIVERVCEILETIVPATKSVECKKHGNKLTLEFVQQWGKGKSLKFEAFNMSDGTLRALGLLMAVFQKPAPSLLVIEEPEATIHPGALGAVLDLIRQAGRTMQVLITTHSPELLDAKWIEDRHLRIVDWGNGASHILKMSEASRAALREHLMGAGELLRSNALLPKPLFLDDSHLRNGGLFETLRDEDTTHR